MDTDQADEPVGWRILDPDGNVIDQGPLIVAAQASSMGESQEEEESNGGD